MSDPPPPAPTARLNDASQLSLAELTDQAGVTVRTVRYYIAEGLLPPPTAGPRGHYTSGHLDRLRLIARMKDAYLPLREIRRRLAGLGDAVVRELLQREERTPPPPPSAASEYLDQVLGAPRRQAGPARAPLPRPDPPPPSPSPRASWRPFPDQDAGQDDDAPPPRAPLTVGVATPLMPASGPPDDLAAEADAWRRVKLADDAELLIRESTYRQRQDRVEWLIRWARRVFG